ncbi:MAG: hypothetical protein ACRD0O_17000 [Acidimicrobiia bacterium]
MADVVFVLATLGFFAACVLYVRGCERIVASAEGRDPIEGGR